MNPIQRLAGQYLFWTQPPAFGMEYMLQDAEKVQRLGTLTWQTSLMMRANAHIGSQQLYIDRLGIMSPRIELREGVDANGALLATFKRDSVWSYNGTLTFEDGRQFKWQSANFWNSHWKWTTPDDGELMKFTPEHKISRMFRSESRIEVYPPAADFPEAELLTVVGWYMMLAMTMDAAAASAAT